ncbi:serine--pyruvate aminotransferase, mitochondrial isoform X1 [Diachasma alloeum]|uniref:serine--pyruvate aminotransferase, mitochondrial isoform X1 n=2 Tax=Diachasma alloeum TaxID=454923 RepID=UPI0007381B91|nr:serine--pyruvate aminotransferase, mitochondrial isoform X1 [Diachasma alloeum]
MSFDYSDLINKSGGLKSPPAELLQPLVVPQGRMLFSPGPSNCSPRVLEALRNPVIGHLHAEILKMMDEIKLGIKYAFQTDSRLTLAISAAGHAGMEACLGNLLEPGETVLIVKGGIWGDRAADMATRVGAHVELLTTELGVAFTLDELEVALKRFRPTVVFCTHAESSTGLKQPLMGVGDLVRKYDALLIVDTVASLGGDPFFMDAWSIDAVYTGSQKVLGAPPGITPVSFGPRAEKKILSRKFKVPVYYWDMKLLGNYWSCFDEPQRNYHHTISATLVYGLREGLAQLAEEGLENSWRRHQKAAEFLRKGLTKLGVKFFVDNPDHRTNTVTSFCLPEGVDGRVVIRRCLERFNVEISGGLGPTAGRLCRIGTMGVNANPERIAVALRALEEAVNFAKSQSKL